MMNRAERLERIVAAINKGGYPSLHDLCRLCEKRERTIHGDLRYLRENLDFEIIHDGAKGGYYNANPEKKLLPVNLTQGELLVLTLGKDMLSEYTGTAFESILRTALDKVAERLPEKVVLDLPNLLGVVRFKGSGLVEFDRRIFFDLNKACMEQSLVRIQYAAASTGQTTFRDIEPLSLVESRGIWYVVAWCRNASDLRKFALHRILVLQDLKEEFEERDIDVDEYMGKAFLLEHGDNLRSYKIRFDAKSARYVRERQWHASQKIDNLEDGSCTMEFTATNLDEVKRWVVVFGPGAEVLEPKELRDALRKELKQTLVHYETSAAAKPLPIKRARIAAKGTKGGAAGVSKDRSVVDE